MKVVGDLSRIQMRFSNFIIILAFQSALRTYVFDRVLHLLKFIKLAGTVTKFNSLNSMRGK